MKRISTKGFLLYFFLAFLLGFTWPGAFAKYISPYRNQKLEGKILEIIKSCSSDSPSHSYLCFKEKIKPVLKSSSVSAVMGILESLSTQTETTDFSGRIICHSYGHVVGEVAIEVGKELGDVIVECGRSCGFGCSHGAALGLLKKDKSLIENPSKVCDRFDAKTSFPGQELTACQHGLGHGFAEIEGFDLVGSLGHCDKLLTERGKIECATGVFMEIFDAPTESHERGQFPEDILSFCKDLPEFYSVVCMRNSGAHEFKRSTNLERAFATCLRLEGDLAKECSESMGADFHFFFKGEVSAILNSCGEGPDDKVVGGCINGAIFSSLVSEPEGSHSILLCKSAEERFQKGCFSHLGEMILGMYAGSKRQEFCAKLEGNQRAYCLGGS